MNPKAMYSMIFWGLILSIFGFAVGGIALSPSISYGMIAFASWRLGAFSRPFRVVAVSSLILMILALPPPCLPEAVTTSRAVGISSLLLQCALGWSLLSCVARDCAAHGQMDLATAARWRRVAYVMILLAVPAVLVFVPSPSAGSASPYLLILPTIAISVAYAVLVGTVQSAKIRLFP